MAEMVELQMVGRGDSEAHRSLRKWYQSLQKILGEAQLYSLLVFSFKRAQEELKANRYIFIGPESDHWLCLSLTNSVTLSKLY